MALIRLNNQSLTAVSALPSAALPEVAFKRVYTAKNTNSVAFSTTPVTLVSVPNVVINAGEEVYLAAHIQARSGQQHHFGLIPHYSGSASGYVGDSSWGIGIWDPSTSGTQWFLATTFVNLSQYKSGGGGPFASTGTFTFDIKSKSTHTNGHWGGETNGTPTTYTPLQVSILIANA